MHVDRRRQFRRKRNANGDAIGTVQVPAMTFRPIHAEKISVETELKITLMSQACSVTRGYAAFCLSQSGNDLVAAIYEHDCWSSASDAEDALSEFFLQNGNLGIACNAQPGATADILATDRRGSPGFASTHNTDRGPSCTVDGTVLPPPSAPSSPSSPLEVAKHAREFWLHAVQHDYRVLEHAPASITSSRAVVRAAMGVNGCAIAWAAPTLQRDRDFLDSCIDSYMAAVIEEPSMPAWKATQKASCSLFKDAGVRCLAGSFRKSASVWEMEGPNGSPFATGKFRFEVFLPAHYPSGDAKPVVRFITPIFHPCIGDGGLFLYPRNDPPWKPTDTIASRLFTTVRSALGGESVRVTDVFAQMANPDAAEMWTRNFELYQQHAFTMACIHANADATVPLGHPSITYAPDIKAIGKFVDICGTSKAVAQMWMADANGDADDAIAACMMARLSASVGRQSKTVVKNLPYSQQPFNPQWDNAGSLALDDFPLLTKATL